MYRLPPEGVVDKLNPERVVLENGNLLLGNRYEFLNAIGSGNFGEVQRCLDRETNLHVAIKIYHTGALLRKKEFCNDSSGRMRMKSALDRVYLEFELRTQLPEDRSWVRPSHVFQTEGKSGEMYMVAEYMELGALMLPVEDSRDPFQFEIAPLRNQLFTLFKESNATSVDDLRRVSGLFVKSADQVRHRVLESSSDGDDAAASDEETCTTDADAYDAYEAFQNVNHPFRTANVLPSEEVVKCFVKDIAEALMKLHDLKIAHRDVKPDNILLSEDGRSKLADFSSASRTDDNFQVFGSEGTHCFYPPECCTTQDNPGEGYDGRAADMWALGVTAWCLLWGQVPFRCRHLDGLFTSISECKYSIPTTGASDLGADVLKQLLCKDPTARLSARQLLEHRWIVSADPSAALVYAKTIVAAKAEQRGQP